MTALLYYSIISELTQNEIDQIDEQVSINQKEISLFVKKWSLNKKRKAIILLLYVFYLTTVAPDAAAVVMPLPPAPIHRDTEGSKISNKMYAQVASIPELKGNKITLTNNQIEQFDSLALQVSCGSMTVDEAILQLRGGDGFTDVVIILAFTAFLNWYNSVFGAQAFQANPLPYNDPSGWLNGKYGSRNGGNPQSQSRPQSRFEPDTFHRMKQICSASADENGFVMDYNEAYNLIQKTYPGSRQITEDCKMSDWQSAKKIYHFQKGFDVDWGKYPNISQDDIKALQKADGGIIRYLQKGGKLPPIELIKDYQENIYQFCHLDDTEINRNVKHYGKNSSETPCTMFFNLRTEQIALFNQTSGDLITAGKFRSEYVRDCVTSGQVGTPKN